MRETAPGLAPAPSGAGAGSGTAAPTDPSRVQPGRVSCPTCKAQVGQPRTVPGSHPSRLRRAAGR
ncbi:zinc finger domain-containing protein [Streptomyces natalensis]|uniref:zinc finger domain-containing protein n=1 Tax=Streptomyces natalensis TaxID=68242 RepID=UPI003B836DBF